MATERITEESALQDPGRVRVWWAVGSCVVWFWLYLADLHLSPTRPIYALAAPVLILITLPFFRRVSRKAVLFAAILMAAFAYQKLIVTTDSTRPAFALIMCVYFFSLAPLRTERGFQALAAGLGVFFAVSFVLFLLTLYVDQARALRSALYAFVEDASIAEFGIDQTRSLSFSQGGLTGLLFVFGYQVAAGVVLLLGLALLSHGLARWAWILAFVAAVGALVLVGERSALAACGLGLLLLLWSTRRWGYTTLVTLSILTALWLFMLNRERVEEVRHYNVFSRVMTSSDTADRLGLQLWAVQKVLQYPMGLELAGADYWDLLARERPQFWAAPHNGYITRTLRCGWLIGVLTVMVLVRLVRMARATLRAQHGGTLLNVERIALAALTAVMANALFHNESFITFNHETMAMLFLYVTCFEVRETAEAEERAAPESAAEEDGFNAEDGLE